MSFYFLQGIKDMSQKLQNVRVRSAPSPTGDPHVGTAYVSLFNYAFAKNAGGTFILRIEDTDRSRSSKESEEAIMRSLRWLGLEWDEGPDKEGDPGPYRQSERFGIYSKYGQKLLENGSAYRCFCTSERLAALRKTQQAQKRPTGYDGLCRALGEDEIEQKMAQNEPYTIRLKVPAEGETSYEDYIRGTITFRNPEIDDQVLLKSDGFPTYHLANVVDDHLMEISHVIRAEEWITSTPKHVLLYNAFGWEQPAFIHLPLLRNKDKSKISKRKNPVSLDWYREKGYLKEALLNFLALMGWSIGAEREKFTLQEMVTHFSWERAKKSGPVFDLQKLDWLNGEYIRAMSPDELLDRIVEEGYTDYTDVPRRKLLSIMELVQDRMKTLSEFDESIGFFFAREPYDAETLIPKKKDASFTAEVLEALKDTLEGVEDWTTESLEQALQAFCEEGGWKRRDVYMPLRVAITCRRVSTPLFETMEILGKKECLVRFQEAVEKCENKG